MAKSAPSPAEYLAAGGPAFRQLEIERYLHDQLLRDTDVFSMAHSIEVRVPYLDHVLLEQASWPVPNRLGHKSRC